MFFGSNSNNNQNDVSTNTSIMPFYSELSQLTIGAWNDKINLRFNPATGKDGNGLTQYNRDKKISSALSQVNASALYMEIKEKIMPMIAGEKEKEKKVVSVSMGSATSKNILSVEYKEDENSEYRVYLTLNKGVTDQGIADGENSISYLFNQTEVMENYDPTTGSGDVKKLEGEFVLFTGILKKHSDLLPFVSHCMRHSKDISKKYASNYSNNNNYNNNNSAGGGYENGFFNDASGMEDGLPFN